jgi:hypothetical protein
MPAPGKPTARKAQSLSGGRKTQEANAGGRKAAGNRGTVAGSSTSGPRITGRIGLMPDLKGC